MVDICLTIVTLYVMITQLYNFKTKRIEGTENTINPYFYFSCLLCKKMKKKLTVDTGSSTWDENGGNINIGETK